MRQLYRLMTGSDRGERKDDQCKPNACEDAELCVARDGLEHGALLQKADGVDDQCAPGQRDGNECCGRRFVIRVHVKTPCW